MINQNCEEKTESLFWKFTNYKIFVHLAAFRDPEIIPTIKNAIEKADNPENISFGVVWQALDEDIEITEELKKLPCKILEIDAKQSLGVCWARSLGQKLLYDEDFILQLDSHHRFEQGWDSLLFELLAQCESPKPILSSYVPQYTPPNNISANKAINSMSASKFDDNGILNLIAAESIAQCKEPQLGMFLAGGFIFARREFYLDIPYDPFIYFQGEEIMLSVRAWTNGWDIFHPHKAILYHYYTRKNAVRHWELDSEWYRLEQRSRLRIKKLLERDLNSTENLEIYGLGTQRTLEEYQEFAGINFAKKEIFENAHKGLPNLAKLNV